MQCKELNYCLVLGVLELSINTKPYNHFYNMDKLLKIIVVLFILNLVFGLFVWLVKQVLFIALVTSIIYAVYVSIFPKRNEAHFQDSQ